MRKLLIVFFLLLLLGVAYEVSAQEILKDKIPVATATCPVDKHYVMGKGKPFVRNCILFMDTESGAGYVLIFDKDKPAVVVEIDPTNGKQKIVWRKGQVSS